jgi:Ubiquitin-2 like Rad60 SUMO-like
VSDSGYLGVNAQRGLHLYFFLQALFTHLPPMASSDHSPENDPLENPQGQVSKNEVKMNDLNTSTEGTAESQTLTHPDTAVASSSSSGMLQPTSPTDGAEATQNPTIEAASTTGAQKDAFSTEPPAATTRTTPELSRLDSAAIGPSTDAAIAPPTSGANTANPVCIITLLLTSGARHPYKLDEKYLTKRNVEVPGVTESGKKDPFSISVYTLKELILREWREEWEAQPSSPSSIRLIHFGRLLDDKTPLKGMKM